VAYTTRCRRPAIFLRLAKNIKGLTKVQNGRAITLVPGAVIFLRFSCDWPKILKRVDQGSKRTSHNPCTWSCDFPAIFLRLAKNIPRVDQGSKQKNIPD